MVPRDPEGFRGFPAVGHATYVYLVSAVRIIPENTCLTIPTKSNMKRRSDCKPFARPLSFLTTAFLQFHVGVCVCVLRGKVDNLYRMLRYHLDQMVKGSKGDKTS